MKVRELRGHLCLRMHLHSWLVIENGRLTQRRAMESAIFMFGYALRHRISNWKPFDRKRSEGNPPVRRTKDLIAGHQQPVILENFGTGSAVDVLRLKMMTTIIYRIVAVFGRQDWRIVFQVLIKKSLPIVWTEVFREKTKDVVVLWWLMQINNDTIGSILLV